MARHQDLDKECHRTRSSGQCKKLHVSQDRRTIPRGSGFQRKEQPVRTWSVAGRIGLLGPGPFRGCASILEGCFLLVIVVIAMGSFRRAKTRPHAWRAVQEALHNFSDRSFLKRPAAFPGREWDIVPTEVFVLTMPALETSRTLNLCHRLLPLHYVLDCADRCSNDSSHATVQRYRPRPGCPGLKARR